MKIRVLKGFGGYKPGQTFEWGDGMARLLIARGVVEPVREDAVERAVVEDREERAVLPQTVKRKAK